jgi:S1-C subfamily serine protease
MPSYGAAPMTPNRTPSASDAAGPAPRRSVGPRLIVGAVLATAVLASGGTYLAVGGGQTATAPVGAAATQAPTTGSAGVPLGPGGQASVVDIVKAVSPAVVTIVAEGVGATDSIFGRGGTGTATGSGVIFDSNGLILTNHHVVAGDPSKLTVNLKDGRTFDATIYGVDTLTDLAIVKVGATGLPTAPIGTSATIEVGQTAIAIGSPLGTFTDSVTSGIISAIGRSIDVEGGRLNNLLQTDTAINPGNSGGPLFDPNGKVIGINTAGNTQAQGMGFAIPIDIARPLLDQASAGEPLARPWLGIRFETIDRTIKQANNLTVDNGAWIPTAATMADQGSNGGGFGGGAQAQDAVVPGSPADQGGLQPGDIITAVEGTTLDATHPLDLVTSQFGPGKSVTLDVLRNGQAIQLTVILGTRPATA